MSLEVSKVEIDGTEYEMWDFTKLKAYACEERGRLAHEEHLIPREPSEAIAFGEAFHKAVEVWTRRAGIDLVDEGMAIRGGRDAAKSAWEAMLPPEHREMLELAGDRRSLGNLNRLFDGFRTKYPLAMYDTIIEVERPFALPLGTTRRGIKVAWCGKRDRVLGWQGGVYYTDIKTSSYALDEKFFTKWKRSGQLIGYAWAGQRELGTAFDGIMVQGVQVQAPLKTKIKPATDLIQSEVIPIEPWQVERWQENVLMKIDKIAIARETGEYAMDDGELCASYKGCMFAKLCNASREAKPLLMDQFFARRVWNPLVDLDTGTASD